MPKNIPVLIGSSPNKKLAKNGYKTIPVNPKIVMLATAYEISLSFAFKTGAVVIIAVTPQIPVPVAINIARRVDCCNFFVK